MLLRSPKAQVMALAVSLLASGCASPARLADSADGMTPGMARAAVVSGDAAAAAGEHRAAADMYARAWQGDPSPAVAVKLGRELRRIGNAQRATVALQDAARRYPSDAAVLTELGRCAMAGGYPQEAEDAFTRAAASRGAAWDTYMAFGAFRARQGRVAEAQAMFERAMTLATTVRDQFSTQANMGVLRAQNGDISGGLAILEQAASHPDVSPKVFADLALLRGLAGDQAGSAAAMQRAMLPPGEAEQAGRWLGGAPEPRPYVPSAPRAARARPPRQAARPPAARVAAAPAAAPVPAAVVLSTVPDAPPEAVVAPTTTLPAGATKPVQPPAAPSSHMP